MLARKLLRRSEVHAFPAQVTTLTGDHAVQQAASVGGMSDDVYYQPAERERPHVIRRLYDLGIDGICTDEPRLLTQAAGERCEPDANY
jgi:glycerophosphoryl diester phosphodiesterase